MNMARSVRSGMSALSNAADGPKPATPYNYFKDARTRRASQLAFSHTSTPGPCSNSPHAMALLLGFVSTFILRLVADLHDVPVLASSAMKF